MPRPTTAIRASGGAAGSVEKSFPIVGIGASAGGLEACIGLFKLLPKNIGMAFVLIQHQERRHKSFLSEILSRESELPIHEAVDGMEVEAGHGYVIPPNHDLSISRGILRLRQWEACHERHLPIDHFFRSLAADKENLAIGVILSGTASDGVLGLIEIKAHGGITFAQEESSAQFPDMPRNAIKAGCVDCILPPGKIAQELIRISSHPLSKPLLVDTFKPLPPKDEGGYLLISQHYT